MAKLNDVVLNGATYELAGSGDGLTDGIKSALLACFQNVGWNDTDGQTYYDALYAALYPPANLQSISAVYTQSGTVYDTDSLDVLKEDLVVTAHYDDGSTETVTDYTLSGIFTVGASTVTVVYGGKTASFSVTVTEKPKAWYTGVPLTLGTVESGNISGTTGEDVESTAKNRTGYIDIDGAHLVQSRIASNKQTTGNNAIFYFYDEDYDFISSAGFSSSNNKFTIAVVPQGTKYVRFATGTDYMGDGATTPYEFVPYATPTVSATTGDVEVTTQTVGYAINTTTGKQGTSGSTRSTQLIPIYGATAISLIKKDSSVASTVNAAFYDKDHNYMGYVQSLNTSTQWSNIPYNECAYIRLNSIWPADLPLTVSITV